MAKLIWSPQALDDLEAICDYIARDSNRYAALFAERAVQLAESIAAHPLLGAIVTEYQQDDLRERLLQSYRVVYRVRQEAVEIVTIVHGARLLPHLPPQ